ncbi:glycosyltransferase [Propionispira raffinosivorans]|uniref:glycosyltransferase n=1 Tax=Propionispira raffinosivorans TaxID=86959 RepID=UPI000370CC40|nr:glycosyltransferase [Propionispira raffinosivorans]
MKISACIITKNEEKNMESYFAKIQGLVQEIILVDTGSTDRTVEIARSHGAKIYQYEWKQDFAAAKNYALQHATGDWIVFLDADEYFPSESIENLKKYLKTVHNNKKCDAIGVRIVNIDIDKDDQEISSFVNIRIFRNRLNLRYKNAIHEEVYNTKGTVHIFMLENDIKVYHTGYSTSIAREKMQRNLAILLKEIAEEGEKPAHYRYLCDCYHGLDDYANAIKYGRLHIEAKLSSLGAEQTVYDKVIDALINSEADSNEIRAEIKRAIQTFPNSPDFYCAYGRFAWLQKNYEMALQYFLKAISLRAQESKGSYQANSFDGHLTAVYFFMGEIYFLKNQSEQALTYYCKSLLRHKYNAEIFQRVYRLLMNTDPIEVISLFNGIYERTQKDISFIIENLSNCPKNKIFAYYSNILTRDFSVEVDSLWQYQMLGLGNYQKLYVTSMESMMQNSHMLASACIAQNNKQLMNEQYIKALNEAFKTVVLRFYDETLKLNEELFPAYETILKELLLIQSSSLDHYLELAEDFSNENILKITKILEEKKKYSKALNVYRQVYLRLSLSNPSEYYEDIGYCSYKLGLYAEAARYFDKVLEKNPENLKILQFKTWSEARC